MTSFIDPTPSQPYSSEELKLVELFIRDQSAVVIRAARTEVAKTTPTESSTGVTTMLLPWLENRHLRGQLENYRRANTFHLILEQQLSLAQSYLSQPDETTRNHFVNGSFKTIYACEQFHYGEIASKNIVDMVHKLGLQDYG